MHRCSPANVPIRCRPHRQTRHNTSTHLLLHFSNAPHPCHPQISICSIQTTTLQYASSASRRHMHLPLAHLGNEHESLPYHEGAEDDHGEVEALEEELALVRPELLELEDLLVYHLPEHCFFVTIQGKICERGGQGGSNATAAERQEQQPNGRGGWLPQAELQGVGGYATVSYLYNVPHFSHKNLLLFVHVANKSVRRIEPEGGRNGGATPSPLSYRRHMMCWFGSCGRTAAFRLPPAGSPWFLLSSNRQIKRRRNLLVCITTDERRVTRT